MNRLLISLLVTLVVSFQITPLAGELFMVRRVLENKTTELQCFINGDQETSLGLAWVLPQGASTTMETHQRWKHKAHTDFVKGHFEYYGHIWEAKNSIEVPAPNRLPPVFDERWNEFPEIKTESTGVAKYLSSFTTDRFHISVLAKGDAQLILHVDQSSVTSMGYLITFDPNGAPGITLELCTGGVHTQHRNSCSLLHKAEKMDGSLLKNGKEWAHFTIQIARDHNAHHIIVSNALKDGKTLLEFRKHAPYHRLPAHLSARTTNGKGQWRLHKYRVVLHNGKDDGEGFNVMTLARNGTSCLHVFYYFRPGYGEAIVRTKDGKHSVELEPTDGQWKFKTIKLPLIAPSDHLHFIVPFGPRLQFVKPVFALFQPFRVCGEREFFTTKIHIPEGEDATNTTCKMVSGEEYATLHSSERVKAPKHMCDTQMFGSYCNITCGAVMGDHTCRSKVMCDSESCYCLPGYLPSKSWDDTCQIESSSNSTVVPPEDDDVIELEEDEDEEINMDSDEEYNLASANTEEKIREDGLGAGWIAVIVISWAIALGSLFLVLKERPDLVPLWILNPFSRCTGHVQSGDNRLINEDA